MNISEKFCPVCKNKNESEALVCKHCGALLESHPSDASGITRSAETMTPDSEIATELTIDESMIPKDGIAVYVEGIAKPIFLYSDHEFIIGRKVGETSETLLDLSPLGGYHLGLSRRHAMIRRTSAGYDIIDLSSSNGTWLNKERLIPNLPYPLESGSQLRLGRMRIFVLFRPVAETKQKI